MKQHPPRVPVCLVTGATGAGKSTFIRALAAARPPAAHWAVLNNDLGPWAAEPDDAALTVTPVGGCACCSGQIMLQTAVVRLLRQARPSRLIIEASAAAEPPALMRTLGQEHLARAVEVTHHFCLATAALWSGCLPAGRTLLLAQMLAADSVVASTAAEAAALLTALAGSGVAGMKVIHAEVAIRLALDSPAPASSASALRISS